MTQNNHKSGQPYFERPLKERLSTYDVNDPLSDYHGFPEHQTMLADEPEILERELQDYMEWYGAPEQVALQALQKLTAQSA